MSTVIKDLGAVSAYAYAVEKGYTGTEAEFAELMADYAEVGQRAEDAAESALNSKTAAQTAATTATNKASEATTAAQTATTKAGEAQTSAQTASTKASEASQSASQASGYAQTAETAKTDAQTAKTQAETARDEAVTAKTAAETAQGKAEDAQAAAESVAESIPSDYSQLSEDVSDLKEDLTQISQENWNTVPISWIQTNQYITYNGNTVSSNYYFQCEIPVEAGEEYLLDGTNDYNKAIYATLDSNGDPVRYPRTGNNNNEVTNISIVIASGETKLVLQANASDRAKYSLTKNNGISLKEGSVGVATLKSDVTALIPSSAFTNLFDMEDPDVVVGSYVSRDGAIHELEQLCISGYIPIEQNVDYIFPVYANYFGSSGTNSVLYVPYYNANKVYWSFATGTYDADTQLLTVKFTSALAKYCRVNFAKQGTYLVNAVNHNPENFMFTKTPYPNIYIPYGEQLTAPTNEVFATSEQQKLNPLYGKKVVFMGDSICAGSSAGDGKSGWAGRIGRKNRMKWWNAGISGGTFTDGLTGSAGSLTNVKYDDPKNTLNPDYIIIEGGTNDADLIGSALGEPLPDAFGSFTLGDYRSEFANTTFCGAIEQIFQTIANDVKTAKVGVIIAPKMGQLNVSVTDYTAEHNNRRRYFKTLMELCEKWGIPYLNLWDGSILNPMIPNQYTYQQESAEDKYYTDGQHLTAEGYDYVSPIIEAWMKTL